MKRTNIYLPEAQLHGLTQLAQGRPMAEIIRQAIAEYIKRNAPKENAHKPRPVWDPRGNVIE